MYNRQHVVMVALADNEARRDPGYDVAPERFVSVLLSNGGARHRIDPRLSSGRPRSPERLGASCRRIPVYRDRRDDLAGQHRARDRSQRGNQGVSTPPIDALFHAMNAAGSSDLHLSVDSPPLIRKDGRLQPLDPAAAPLTITDMATLLKPIMPEKNRAEFDAHHDTDFAYEIAGLARFRANVFADRKGPGAVFRVIPTQDPDRRTTRALVAHSRALPLEQGARARHRPDRLRKVDDAVRDDRPHQSDAARPHHHDRGSDRVRPPEQDAA